MSDSVQKLNLITSQSVRRDFASRTSSDLQARLKSKLKRPKITLTVGSGHACDNSECDTSTCTGADRSKRKRSDSESSSASASASPERSEIGYPGDVEEGESEESTIEASVELDDGESENVDYKGSDRARLFQDFLNNVDGALIRFHKLDKCKPRCSTCDEESVCDLFCRDCCDFFCKECHDSGKGNSERHCTAKWNSDQQSQDIFFPSFTDTFQIESRQFCIDAAKTLCSCEQKDVDNCVSCDLIFLGEDFRLWEVRFNYCSACCCAISACLRYGFLLIPTKGHTVPNIASSLELCDFITSLQDLSLRDLLESISNRNWGLLYAASNKNLKIKLADLALIKYAYCQVVKRLEEAEIELCPCCWCPRRKRLCPDVLIEDYTNLHRSDKGSDAKLKNLLTTLVKDEDYFADYGDIFAKACKAGESSSLPQDAPVQGKKKKTCVDKFKLIDRYSKRIDIKKLLVVCCGHACVKIAAISRKPAERSQYCLAVAAKVQEVFDILLNDFSFDAACKLLPVALAALAHVPKPLHDNFLKQFCSGLKYGPFHSPNHTVDCQLTMDVTILGDVIESIFKVLKCNKVSLRPMILAFWICEVDYRLCAYQDKKLENLGVTSVKFIHKLNPTQMQKLQQRIFSVAQKVYPEISTEDIYNFESFAEKAVCELQDENLQEERIESLSLRYMGLRLRLKYLEVALAKLRKKKGIESVLPALMPPKVWKHTCGPSPKDKDRLVILIEKVRGELQGVIKSLKKLPLNKEGDYFKIGLNIDDQPAFQDQQINYLITKWLEQRLLDLHALIFSEEREEKIFQKEIPDHKERGDSHMRSQWKLAQLRRNNLVEFKQIYNSLYLHLQTDVRRKDVDLRYFCTIKEILTQARNLDVIWSSEYTARASLKIILLQDCRKLLARIRLQFEGKLWIQRWCCNICLRLLLAVLEVKGHGESSNSIGSRMKIKKYLKASKRFLSSKVVKKYERSIQSTFRNFISQIMGRNSETIDPNDIIDAFDIPEYDEAAKENPVAPSPSNPGGKSAGKEETRKRLMSFHQGSSDIELITYAADTVESRRFKAEQKALIERYKPRSANEENQQDAASSESAPDPISIPVEPPTIQEDFHELCQRLIDSRPQNVKMLNRRRNDLKRAQDRLVEGEQEWEASRNAYLAANKAFQEALAEWQSQVRQFGIERHPCFKENPVSADMMKNLIELGIWGEEISIIHDPNSYGSDTQCKALESLLRENDFENEVTILTSRHYIGASFSEDEIVAMGGVNVRPPAGCMMRQIGEHYTASAVRVDDRLDYCDSSRPGDRPTNSELMQMSILFDVKKRDNAMLIFSWNTQRQNGPQCLYFAFLNLYLLLSGYNLAEIKVQESFLRIWTFECFKSKLIKCPFQFGVVEMIEEESSEEMNSEEEAPKLGTFYAAMKQNQV